jgi:hypothetical protein
MTRNPLPTELAAQAALIVETLTETKYVHIENIDQDAGVFDCDCSGFVSFIIQSLAPGHYALIPKEPTQPRPRAFKFYEFLHALSPTATAEWTKIDSLLDAAAGDILAWRFLIIEAHHDTGHVVFLAETPTTESTGVVRVRVYDSAEQAHFDDTRGPDEDQFPTGVGSGVLKFQVDDQGRPTAFLFAPGDRFVTLPIAIGRTEPPQAHSAG